MLAAAWVVGRVGGFRTKEMALLKSVGRELGVPDDVAARVERAARALKRRRFWKVTVPSGDAARRLLFHYAVHVAGADGRMMARERQIAERLGSRLDLSPMQVAAELDALVLVPQTPSRSRKTESRNRHLDRNDVGTLLASLGGGSWLAEPPAGLGFFVVVLANLVPVIGVFYFDWEIFTIFFLYWMETAVIGFYNVLKMRVAKRSSREPPILLIPFFMLHYGGFMTAHGVFIIVLFLKPESPSDLVVALGGWWLTLAVALVTLFIEHGYAHYFDYLGGKKYEKTDTGTQMFKPYGRIIVMHVTIILGGLLADAYGSPRVALLMLIAFKTLIDLVTCVFSLPERGVPGRIKSAFKAGAALGLFCFVAGLVLLCLPGALIGVASHFISPHLFDERFGGVHWGVYMIPVAAGIGLVAAIAASVHDLVEGRSRS